MTMVSWLMETSLPRIRAGAISAIYIGERLDARPMATPPSIRQQIKIEKVARQRVAERSAGKQERGKNQQPLASEFVAQRAGHQRADETADERATVGPADLRVTGQMKISFEKRLRAADDHPVVAKKQSAQRGDDGDEPDVAEVVFGLEV